LLGNDDLCPAYSLHHLSRSLFSKKKQNDLVVGRDQLPEAEAQDLARNANEFIGGAHEFLEQTSYMITEVIAKRDLMKGHESEHETEFKAIRQGARKYLKKRDRAEEARNRVATKWGGE